MRYNAVQEQSQMNNRLYEFSFYRIWQRKDHEETIIHGGDRTQLEEL